MQIKLANYAMVDIREDFKSNLTVFNEIVYTASAVIIPVCTTHQ